MKKIIAATIALAILPAVASAQSANRYVNNDHIALSFVDYDGTNAIRLDGRNGITQNGKIAYGIENNSDADVTSLNAGYRHTFAPISGFTLSATAGLYYFDFASGSETDLYLMGDGEMGVGPSGVAHAKIILVDGDLALGGGYTHYFTPNMGVRGEVMLGDADSLSIGGVYAF